MKQNIIILIIALSIVGGAFGYGIHKGTVWEKARNEEKRQELQQEIFDLTDNLSLKNAEILRLNREKEDLINDLEQQALQAPGSDNPGVGSTGGLQRLERRWGTSTNSP